MGGAGKKSTESGGKEKKSVFGKLFDRDKNNSSVSVASSSQGMERGGSSEGQLATSSSPGTPHLDVNGGDKGAGGHPLMRRKSGADRDREKKEKQEEKEHKEREKKERKEREKREKEETKEREREKKTERERERSASRGRTPSQNGRPRSGSHGEHHNSGGHHEKGGLGGAMDFMRIKVQRKTSVTSRKSDDGKSDHGEQEKSQYGGSEKSRGDKSNASLSKKYGVCDKVIVGKGATAVVRLAHKWDRSTERLYAVKVSYRWFLLSSF